MSAFGLVRPPSAPVLTSFLQTLPFMDMDQCHILWEQGLANRFLAIGFVSLEETVGLITAASISEASAIDHPLCAGHECRSWATQIGGEVGDLLTGCEALDERFFK